jgi:AraC-like DNA-binding protein
VTVAVQSIDRGRHGRLPAAGAGGYRARMDGVEVSAGIGAVIVQAAVAAGVAAADLQAATGFDARVAADPDARITLATETALWDEAARRTGDPAFGLHAAGGLRPGVFDVLDYVFRTAPTLRAALDRVARYNRLLHDVAAFTLVDAGGGVTRVEHTLIEPGLVQSRHAAEFTLASIVTIGGQMAGRPLRPRAVEFRHAAAPPAQVEHERLFGVAPRFGCAVNALAFEAAELARPLPGADPVLSRVVVRHAEALLAARPAAPESAGHRVRRFLAAALADGEAQATLAAAAAKLHMSERSLQRRLTDEGTTFDGLLEELRRGLALRYLSDQRVAIAQIAYLLGYSEPSAFHRAFKRWTGKTPTEARQQGV